MADAPSPFRPVFYKIRWGFQDEFVELFERTTGRCWRAQMELAASSTCRLHATLPRRRSPGLDFEWPSRNRDWPSMEEHTDPPSCARLYPDAEKLKREEQRRMECSSSWDTPLEGARAAAVGVAGPGRPAIWSYANPVRDAVSGSRSALGEPQNGADHCGRTLGRLVDERSAAGSRCCWTCATPICILAKVQPAVGSRLQRVDRLAQHLGRLRTLGPSCGLSSRRRTRSMPPLPTTVGRLIANVCRFP